MSTILFNLVLEIVVRNNRLNIEETIFKDDHQSMAFANGVIVITKHKKGLKKIISRINEWGRISCGNKFEQNQVYDCGSCKGKQRI